MSPNAASVSPENKLGFFFAVYLGYSNTENPSPSPKQGKISEKSSQENNRSPTLNSNPEISLIDN